MRRTPLLAAAVALILAGCGSSSSQSPQDTELSYFPAGTPVVLVLQTDPNGLAYQNASAFVAKFPLARFALAAIQSSLAKSGVNYAQQIQPLLGNPVALGAPSSGTASGSRFLLVFIAKSSSKLGQVLKSQPAPQSEGSYQGANLYQTGSYAMAINGATLLLGTSMSDVKNGLALHAHGGGLTASSFNQALSGLPHNTLVQVYGDLTNVLSARSAAQARLIPWVAAIRSYGATISVSDSGINVSFRIDTSGHSLSSNQLPLSPSTSAPSASSTAPLAAGLSDFPHTIAFGEAAVQAADPAGWAKAVANYSGNGVSLSRDVLGQFNGSGELDYGAGGILAKADLADPAAARRTVAKLKTLKPIGGGFYESKTARKPAKFGVVGTKFVIGNASESVLTAFASAPAAPIAGAAGPLAFRMSLQALITLALKSAHTNLGSSASLLGPALSSFGDIVGYATNTASGMTGSITLPLH